MRFVGIAFVLLIALSLFRAEGQIVVEIQNSNNTGYWVMMGPVGYVDCQATRTQYIYTAAELLANGAPVGGGKIPAIQLYQYMSLYSIPTAENVNIFMAHTTATDLYSGTATFADETQVWHRDSWTIPSPGYSWYRYDFDQPFEWNGVDNILVTHCRNSGGVPAVYGTWLHALQTRYGYPIYPIVAPQSYMATYTYDYDQLGAGYGSGNQTPADWCHTLAGPQTYGPYSIYYRADMRFEICNEAPLVYDMTCPALMYLPGSVPVTWTVGRTMGNFTVTVTLNLYTPGGMLVKSESFPVPINADTKNGVYQFALSGVPAGYYRLEAVFNGLDECANYTDHFVNRAIMILEPGSVPCEVWPGDVNNNGIVNYGDRADLNKYIHDANLSPLWLTGPARYRVDMDVNPLTYYNWEMQPSVPWYTPEGCYMDSDGNGMINNFDYIAIKLNWMRSHGLSPSKADQLALNTDMFYMDQNFPNPFNPTTSISYNLPERSKVRLVVSDMLGREVATLVDGTVEQGTHLAEFDGSQLSSGHYVAQVLMTGLESGTTFTKTIKMTLGK
jgi:hypothetical protein